MKTKFDPKTLADWSARSVSEVTVDFVAGGCAGTKIAVTEGAPESGDFAFTDIGSIRMHYPISRKEILSSSVITKLVANGKTKWILASSKIKSRCDCGSSFATDSSVKPLPKIDLSRFFAKKKERDQAVSGEFKDSE